MTKSKKLGLMLGLLGILCLAALAAGSWKSHVEDIAVSGETLLELPASSIQSFSWDEDGEERLAFHRDGENWVYDEDEDFPADNAKVDALLADFASFGVSFAISESEDPADYGLDDPVAALHLTTTEGKDYDFQLGDFSQMDAQRYLSFGDGKIYLAVHDPWEDFSNATLQTLIQDADVPDLQKDLRHPG